MKNSRNINRLVSGQKWTNKQGDKQYQKKKYFFLYGWLFCPLKKCALRLFRSLIFEAVKEATFLVKFYVFVTFWKIFLVEDGVLALVYWDQTTNLSFFSSVAVVLVCYTTI